MYHFSIFQKSRLLPPSRGIVSDVVPAAMFTAINFSPRLQPPFATGGLAPDPVNLLRGLVTGLPFARNVWFIGLHYEGSNTL
jgi:hypothetical protein